MTELHRCPTCLVAWTHDPICHHCEHGVELPKERILDPVESLRLRTDRDQLSRAELDEEQYQRERHWR